MVPRRPPCCGNPLLGLAVRLAGPFFGRTLRYSKAARPSRLRWSRRRLATLQWPWAPSTAPAAVHRQPTRTICGGSVRLSDSAEGQSIGLAVESHRTDDEGDHR